MFLHHLSKWNITTKFHFGSFCHILHFNANCSHKLMYPPVCRAWRISLLHTFWSIAAKIQSPPHILQLSSLVYPGDFYSNCVATRDEPITKIANYWSRLIGGQLIGIYWLSVPYIVGYQPCAVSQGATWQTILSKYIYNGHQGFANRVKRKWLVVNINKLLIIVWFVCLKSNSAAHKDVSIHLCPLFVQCHSLSA